MVFSRVAFHRHAPWLQKWKLSKHYHTQATEMTISVPWGHVAGKRWGNEPSQPVIALHGMFDNAASFDKLFPLLNIGRPILALDIPGYGRSTNPPLGLSPSYFEILLWLRYLIKFHFKWEKVSLLGHSFGSNLSFAYSSLFPDEVEKYVSIDCSKVNMASKPEYMLDDLRTGYSGGSIHSQGILKEGSLEEFLENMMKGRSKVGLALTEDQCRILLTRDLEEVGTNRYRSLVDTRPYLRYMGRPTLPFLEAMAEKIKSEVLTIRASKGILVGKRLEIYEKHIEIMKNNTKVVSKTIDGGHHVHLDNPAGVAKMINAFFK